MWAYFLPWVVHLETALHPPKRSFSLDSHHSKSPWYENHSLALKKRNGSGRSRRGGTSDQLKRTCWSRRSRLSERKGEKSGRLGQAPTWANAGRVTYELGRVCDVMYMLDLMPATFLSHTHRHAGKTSPLTGGSTSSDEPLLLLPPLYLRPVHVTHRWPGGGSRPVPVIMGPAPSYSICTLFRRVTLLAQSACRRPPSRVNREEHPWPARLGRLTSHTCGDGGRRSVSFPLY